MRRLRIAALILVGALLATPWANTRFAPTNAWAAECDESKIRTLYEAAAARDTETIWATFSPKQVMYQSQEAFLSWFEDKVAALDQAADERVRQRVLDLTVELMDDNEEVCNYRVLLKLESITSQVRIHDFVEFHVLMDRAGILTIEKQGQLPPVIKYQRAL
jgi:hypothetical protein